MNYLNYPLLNNSIYSSNNEKPIKIWKNGKPVYRYIIEGTSGGDNSWKIFSAPSDIEDIVLTSGIITDKNGAILPFPYYNYDDTNMALAVYIVEPTKNRLSVLVRGVLVNCPFTIIVEYTKKTDNPLITTEEILTAYLADFLEDESQTLASIASKSMSNVSE